MEYDEILILLKNNMEFRKVKKSSIVMYLSTIKEYLRYCIKYNIDIFNVTTTQMREYFLYQRQNGIKASTMNSKLSTIKFIYKTLYNNDMVKLEVYFKIRDIKKFKSYNNCTRSIITEKKMIDIANIMELCSEVLPNPTNGRGRAIIYFFFYTGAKYGEFLNFKRESIDFKKNVIYFDDTYRNNKWEIPLHPNLRKALLEYFKQEEEVKFNAFNTSIGMLRKYLNEIKVFLKNPKFRIRDFRHSYAKWLRSTGLRLPEIQLLMRIYNVKTARVYIKHNTKDIIKLLRKKVNAKNKNK